MSLVFGCRHPEEDHLYQEEMQEMVRKRVLFQVHTGYSRLPGKPKVSAATQQAGRARMMAPVQAIQPFHSKPAVKTVAQWQGEMKSTMTTSSSL